MGDQEWLVGASDAGLRLDKFLAADGRLGSRARAFEALERGKVLVNGRDASAADASSRIAAGDVVRLWMSRPGSSRPRSRTGQVGALHVVHEDDALIVLDKPAGVLAVPLERRGTAVSMLDLVEAHFRRRGMRPPQVVHRIDRDTSGLVVFARDPQAQQVLKDQFRRREPERIYLAVLHGHPHPAAGTWRDRLAWDVDELVQKEASRGDPRATEAVADYRIIERFGPGARAALVEVRLITGKRNQIRVQASLRGHPLVGERQYIDEAAGSRDRIPFDRQALHAHRLAFRHPRTGRLVAFEAPLPPDLQELVARLRQG